MKKFRSTITIGLLIPIMVLSFSLKSFGQFPDGIILATQKTDAKELSVYFNSKVELVLPQKSGVFSKSQARLVLEDFFNKNPNTQFKIIHQGDRENSSFAIGKYRTTNKVYRFYFLTKTKNEKTYIHQLRIEKEDD
ncbi:DUF4783 domain-containing protein [Labilibacter sediminis]|nr:DUF4783 domain-containing protein [Labilibacter sediminis]